MYFQILIVFYSQSTFPDCVYKLNKLIVWATQSGFDWGERDEIRDGPKWRPGSSLLLDYGMTKSDSKIRIPS